MSLVERATLYRHHGGDRIALLLSSTKPIEWDTGRALISKSIWVRSQRCGSLVICLCYHLITEPENKTAAPSDPYAWIDI